MHSLNYYRDHNILCSRCLAGRHAGDIMTYGSSIINHKITFISNIIMTIKLENELNKN